MARYGLVGCREIFMDWRFDQKTILGLFELISYQALQRNRLHNDIQRTVTHEGFRGGQGHCDAPPPQKKKKKKKKNAGQKEQLEVRTPPPSVHVGVRTQRSPPFISLLYFSPAFLDAYVYTKQGG